MDNTLRFPPKQWRENMSTERCGCITRSLITLFHKHLGKYRTPCIKPQKNSFTLLQKCTNRSTRFQEAVDIFVMTDALTWSVRAQIQKSKIFGSGTHEVTLRHYSSTTLYISFDISPERAFCSQCFCVSATCWSSRLCFYSLWHHAACPSDGLVLLCLPASLSSSACWCKR